MLRQTALNFFSTYPIGCIVLLITFVAYSTQEIRPDACLARQAPGIPKWHIYHRLCKPLIIGHRGNPIYYQENTLEGFRSVHKFGGNAIELDVYLTKDEKLVLFHDKNALVSECNFRFPRKLAAQVR